MAGSADDKGRDDENFADADEFPDASLFRLVFLSLVVIAPIMTPGMTTTFSSIALPQMQLSLDEASWFASITSVACPFGSLFIGFIIDKYGRRISLVSSIIPSIIGWFLLADANASLTQLYLGRALTGFALGACLLPPPIYAAECITVNHIQIRSSVGTCTTFSMVTGGLLMYAFSVVLPYDKVALISGVLSALSLLLILIFIPESPAWLYRKGRVGDARRAQSRLGIRQPILQDARDREIVIVGAGQINNRSKPDNNMYSLKKLFHYVTKIGKREVYKPLVITMTFLFFSEFSGLYCLLSFMIEVITVYPLDTNPYLLSVIGQVVQMLGCVLLTFVLPHSGVKILSIVSFLGVSLGFLALAFSVLFFEEFSSSTIFSYVHVLSIWAIMLSGNLGVLAIPYAILGEMFPMGSKGYASLSLLADAIFSFIILKIFPYLFAQYRNSVFFVFSAICACGAVFVAVYLPETVGKTMDEIQREFKQKVRTEEEHWHSCSPNVEWEDIRQSESDLTRECFLGRD